MVRAKAKEEIEDVGELYANSCGEAKPNGESHKQS